MSAQPRVFVVVPAYNEDAVVSQTVRPLLQAGFTVIVVDDGSETPSEDYLSGSGVIVLRHVTNLGQGAALQTGVCYALSSGAEIIVHFDADGQHDPNQIPSLIEPIIHGEADITTGSRFLRRADRLLVPPSKRLALRIGRVVSGLMTGIWLTDTHNGFRAYSAKAAESIELRENGFAHATDILSLIKAARLRHLEVPVTIRYSIHSMRKGQRIWNGFNIICDLLLRKVFR